MGVKSSKETSGKAKEEKKEKAPKTPKEEKKPKTPKEEKKPKTSKEEKKPKTPKEEKKEKAPKTPKEDKKDKKDKAKEEPVAVTVAVAADKDKANDEAVAIVAAVVEPDNKDNNNNYNKDKKDKKDKDSKQNTPKAEKKSGKESKASTPKVDKKEKAKDSKPNTPKVDKKSKEAEKNKLTDAEISFLVANTHFNRSQIEAIHTDFLKDCPSGRISKKDFIRLFKQLHPLENKNAKADKYCEYAFNAFDADHDSYISFAEFCVAFSVTSFGELREKVQFAFRVFDLDRDGKINQNDLLKVITSLYDLNGVPSSARKGNNEPKTRVEKLLKHMGVNSKDSLKSEEFIEKCLNDQAVREFLVDPIYASN